MAAKLLTIDPLLERYSFTACNLLADEQQLLPSLSNNDTVIGSLRITGSFECDSAEGTRIAADGSSSSSESPMLESNTTVAGFVSPKDQLTISIWMTPVATATDDSGYYVHHRIQPIVTFGETHKNVQQDVAFLACPGYDLRIAQIAGKIVISFTDQALTCQHLKVKQQPLVEALTHVAIVFDSTSVSVFINGQNVVRDVPKTIDTAQWSTNTTLQVFSNVQSDVVFAGYLHQLDLYDSAMQDDAITDIYQEGIFYMDPATKPVLVARQLAEPVTIAQDTSTTAVPIQLGGWNRTTASWKLAVQVTSLPKHGTLLIRDKNETVTVKNSLFPFFGDATGVTVDYIPDEDVVSDAAGHDYFNTPETNMYGESLHREPESFTFRIVAIRRVAMVGSEERVVVSVASNNVTVPVYVRHVNHEPVLTVPDEATALVVDSSTGNSVVLMTGIDFADPLDYNLDLVRVDLSVGQGEATLDPAYRFKAIFDSCLYRGLSAWQCVGDGINDRRMSFLAIPDDIPLILGNLSYKAFYPGQQDEITIRVFDGAGGMCLHEKEHAQYHKALGNTFPTVHHGCFELEATVTVPSYDPDNTNSVSGSAFTDSMTAELLFWGGVTFLVLLCVFCGCRRVPSCLARGSHVTDGNSCDRPSIV